MASITNWNRIEPRPRSQSLLGGLHAAVRDPLWLLFRQWQFGEFHGDDSGSPSYIRVASTTTPTSAWRLPGGSPTALPGGPLEATLLAEPRPLDLALRIEIGQAMERQMRSQLQGRSEADQAMAVAALRVAHALPAPDGGGAPVAMLPLDAVGALATGFLAPRVVALLEAAGVPCSARASCVVLQAAARWKIHDPAYDRSFEMRLAAGGVEVRPAPLGDWHGDPEATRLARVCAGRALDGGTVLQAVVSASPILPAALPAWMQEAATGAAAALAQLVADTHGLIGHRDPSTWRPEQLSYGLELLAPVSDSEALALSAAPGDTGTLPWSAFDRVESVPLTSAVTGAPVSTSSSMFAGRIGFPGMPARRWWALEPSTTSFPAITADHTDVAKLLVIDFMLVHGDDWFIQSLTVPVGSMTRIDELTVHDVFGVTTSVKRADAQPVTDPAERWTLYSTTDRAGQGTSEWFLVPASAGSSSHHGPELEVVQLLRDEIADLVWAVDEVVEDGAGLPRPASDWAAARKPAMPAPRVSSTGTLRYVLQTGVPEHWTPFQPTLIEPSLGLYALRRLRQTHPRTWAGLILEPSSRSGMTYDIAEREVPREGRRIARRTSRTRWADGSVHVWTSRRRGVGRGEGSSGLRFDLAGDEVS